MIIEEYQAKKILKKFHIPIPPCVVISNLSQAKNALKKLKTKQAIQKAQIPLKKRKKLYAIITAKTVKNIVAAAKKLFNHKFLSSKELEVSRSL